MYFWAVKRILDSRVTGLLLRSLRVVVSSFRVVKFPYFLQESRGSLHCGPVVPGACGQDDLNFLYAILRIAFLT